MSIFAATYIYGPAEEQAKFRPEHRVYLSNLVDQKKVIASGPFTTGPAGALLLFEASTEEDVIALIEADPMKVGGAVLSYTIREWNPVLGSLG